MCKTKLTLCSSWSVLLLALYLLYSLPLDACESNNVNWADSVHHLHNVTVTANRIPKEIIPIQLLSGEQLQRLSVHSVADALLFLWRSNQRLWWYRRIEDGQCEKSWAAITNGVFYDGIELGNAQNGVIDLGRFSLDNMEAVSLYNGQKSAIFQPAKDFASASTYLYADSSSSTIKYSNHIKRKSEVRLFR